MERRNEHVYYARILRNNYYVIAKLEAIKIGYRRELHDRFKRRYSELEISKQGKADHRRAIVTTGLI